MTLSFAPPGATGKPPPPVPKRDPSGVPNDGAGEGVGAKLKFEERPSLDGARARAGGGGAIRVGAAAGVGSNEPIRKIPSKYLCLSSLLLNPPLFSLSSSPFHRPFRGSTSPPPFHHFYNLFITCFFSHFASLLHTPQVVDFFAEQRGRSPN